MLAIVFIFATIHAFHAFGIIKPIVAVTALSSINPTLPISNRPLIPIAMAMPNIVALTHPNLPTATKQQQKAISRYLHYSSTAQEIRKLKDAVSDSWHSIIDDHHDLVGFVAFDKKQNEIVVSFRGTIFNSVKNWMVNAQLEQDFLICGGSCGESSGIKVHRGFQKAYSRKIRNEVRTRLEEEIIKHKNAKIVFTGYSMGGSLATLAALDFSHQKKLKNDKTFLYTYGQPRMGNNAFAKHVNSVFGTRYTRITHTVDIVPRLPPPNFAKLDWVHGGTEYWVHSPDKIFVAQGGSDKSECEDPRGIVSVGNLANVKTTKDLLMKKLTNKDCGDAVMPDEYNAHCHLRKWLLGSDLIN